MAVSWVTSRRKVVDRPNRQQCLASRENGELKKKMREKLKPPKIGGELYQQADKSISEQPRKGEIFSKN